MRQDLLVGAAASREFAGEHGEALLRVADGHVRQTLEHGRDIMASGVATLGNLAARAAATSALRGETRMRSRPASEAFSPVTMAEEIAPVPTNPNFMVALAEV